MIRFAYDESGAFCLDSTCFATGADLKYITAYLNTTLSINELLKNAPQTGTGDVITSVQALEPHLIPSTSKENKIIIENLMDLLLDAKLRLDTEQIHYCVIKIKEKFHDILSLTDDEVNYIENNS